MRSLEQRASLRYDSAVGALILKGIKTILGFMTIKPGGMRILSTVVALAIGGGVLPAQPEKVQSGEMAGYLLVPNDKVPESFNAGFSMYVAAWPLLREYPGNRFQTGLFGTWMFAQYERKGPTNLYSDVEGG